MKFNYTMHRLTEHVIRDAQLIRELNEAEKNGQLTPQGKRRRTFAVKRILRAGRQMWTYIIGF